MKKLSIRFWQQLPTREKRVTLSTAITIGRLLLVPLVAAAMLYGWWGAACVLFVIAAVSDMLDGAIARWRQEQTVLGACLDPLADKLLILTCFGTLAYAHTPLFSIPHWFVWLVLSKELLLIAGALWFWARTGTVQVQPSMLGKATMLFQVCFIMWLFACFFFHWMPVKTYYTMLGLMALLSAACLMHYLYRALIALWRNRWNGI